MYRSISDEIVEERKDKNKLNKQFNQYFLLNRKHFSIFYNLKVLPSRNRISFDTVNLEVCF